MRGMYTTSIQQAYNNNHKNHPNSANTKNPHTTNHYQHTSTKKKQAQFS